MIYILAPYNLNVNTTSRNRILSFYTEIKKQGLDVAFLNPPMLANDREAHRNGLTSQDYSQNSDFINIEFKPSYAERFVAVLTPNPKYKRLAALVNLCYMVLKRTDYQYPVNSLQSFFVDKALSPDDILIASGGPFSLFKAGLFLTQKYRCKLFLDYRDPWNYGYDPIDAQPLMSKLKRRISLPLENECLKEASYVTCDSLTVKGLFPPEFQQKIGVILNGANLQAIDKHKIIDHYPVFRIVYLGTIYNDQLIDETFFLSVRKLIQKHKLTKNEFEIIFVGSDRNIKLKSVIRSHGLEFCTIVTKRLEITEAMEIAYTAAVFLHLKYGDRMEVDTSKQLDYLALQKPILLPVSDNGNVVKSILLNQAGYVCHSVDECVTALEQLFEKHKSGISLRISRSEEFLYNISREAEAAKLVEIIRQHVSEEEADVATGLL